ncbi:MAG: DUF5343 domain-containing protein [Candidatus Thiodiazotropha taylori]|nr:DUF5343 domain-containing protein [Candidatus Thiodiazotropha taylori]
MADESGKKLSPPYVSYTSFTSFIKGLSETHVPDRIDKTVMSNYSGSTVYALLPALQWLELIDEHGNPQPILDHLTNANDTEYQELLNKLVKEKYSFLFNGGFDLAKASSGQVIEAFKQQDISGSTVTKCMSFFLAIAKSAGIKVSSHVKAPTVKRSPVNKKKKSAASSNPSNVPDAEDRQSPEGTEKISFTLRGMPDVVIYFPAGLDEETEIKRVIRATVFNLEMYYGVQLEGDD